MSEEMRKLVAKRASIKAKLTRFKSFLDKIGQTHDFAQLEDRMVTFRDSLSEFDSVQSEIELLDSDSDHNLERELFEDLYFELLARSKILVPKPINNSAIPQTHSEQSHQSLAAQVKLPTIKLPTFGGKYEDWTHYQELFKTLIDDNCTLSPIQKFHYLKSSLQGQALSVIDSLEVSTTNYETAWILLKTRFENKRIIVSNHVTALFDLKRIDRESGAALRHLLDSLNQHIRALSSLGQPTEHWDSLLVHITTRKLDYNTVKLWENQQLTTEIPTFKELSTFIENRCNVLESLEINRPNLHSTKPSTPQLSRPQTNSKKFSSSLVSSTLNCALCNSNHKLFQCGEFLKIPVSERYQTVKKLGLCINCLSKDHLIKECKASNCKTCMKKHNTLLHFNSEHNSSPNTQSSSAPPPATLASHVTSNHVLLSTAVVDIEDVAGNKHECRVLLDSASQSNFITESMVSKLNLSKEKSSTQIRGVGEKLSSVTYLTKCTIHSRCNSYKATLNCLVLPKITQNLPHAFIDTSSWKIPTSFILADPSFNSPGPIDMLVGAEFFMRLLCIGQMRPQKGAPIFQKTSLGWVASGKVSHMQTNETENLLCHLTTDDKLHSQMQKFWELESCEQPESQFNSEKAICEQTYTKTTVRDTTGRYTVTLPVKDNLERLVDNRNLAESRFYQLEKKLSKNSTLHQAYSNFMTEYEELGHMELVSSTKCESSSNKSVPTYYIPHLPVIREDSSTTKLRVVFDASAKTASGLSLNDTLMVGPTIQQDVFTILTRFRCHKYVLTADIEKMYRQIRVNEQQADLQRILWRNNNSEPLKIYKLTTVTYGTASAPFLAIRTLQQLAQDERKSYPIGSRVVMNDFYVDDLMTGSNTIEELSLIQTQVSKLLSSGGFNIRKWNSNSHTVLRQIDDSLRAQTDDVIEETPTKVLGILWNAGLDYFQYSVKEQHPYTKISKRSVLSEIASIFDPLGFLGPIIVKAKLFMQELWELNVSWDESLPSELHSSWQVFRKQLVYLRDVKIHRHVFSNEAIRSELHGFCDASERAYGACIYVRSIQANGEISVNLLSSKSRVSPLKKTTIPRLELCGALLLSELVNKINKTGIHFSSYTLWSDSTVALAWIKASPTNWKTFVSNRVKEVQRLTGDNCTWNHVGTTSNPADLVSRGLNPVQIVDRDLWWYGPAWLSQKMEYWPRAAQAVNTNTELPEQRKCEVSLLTLETAAVIDTSRYSQFQKLQRVTAYCLRFVNNTRQPYKKQIGAIVASELQAATTHLLKADQQVYLHEDYRRLKSGKQVKPNSHLRTLQPFIDLNGIVRVGGRLRHANIHPDQKHPIILSPKSHLTELIVKNEHIRQLHAGPQLMLASLRQRYWPLKGRDIVRKAVHSCVKCFRAKPRSLQPQMGDIPASRLQVTHPFSNTGTDFCGPIFIRTSRRRNSPKIKSYVVLFVCMTTKAIHLELASDLTTEAFLAAFKRFISRRGICNNVYLDNGTNYVGASRELKELRDLFKTQEHQKRVIEEASIHNITWHFIPPKSPHFGGLWIAGVKSMKYHLKRVVGNVSLTYEAMYTVLTLIEACLNSRPLLPISNHPNDPLPLTPGHFLTGRALTTLPEPSLLNISVNRLSMWQQTQQMAQHFWARWSKEYLAFLQQRPKWTAESTNISPGQLVVIREDNLPPMNWVTGRITEVHPGDDGRVRVATVKTTTGVYKRAVNRLCVLPVE